MYGIEFQKIDFEKIGEGLDKVGKLENLISDHFISVINRSGFNKLLESNRIEDHFSWNLANGFFFSDRIGMRAYNEVN